MPRHLRTRPPAACNGPWNRAHRNLQSNCGDRLDLLAAGRLIVELKACDCPLPKYEAQLLTYLKLTGIKVGLLINFDVPILKQGIKRLAN